MDPVTLQAAGTVFGLHTLFERAYDYFKGIQETREVQHQLKNVLQSMNHYAESSKASQKSGKILRLKFVNLKTPITTQNWESLVKASIKFCNDFRGVLSSVLMFGKECNSLISGDVEGFMQKVEIRKPEVYDLIRFFGRNYDPKTDSLDLTNLPMLFRIYGQKIKKKESNVLSKEVKGAGKWSAGHCRWRDSSAGKAALRTGI